MNKQLIIRKRRELMQLGAGGVLGLALLYLMLVRGLQGSRVEQLSHRQEVAVSIETATRGAQMAETLEAELKQSQAELTEIESVMASGDVYFWMVKTLQQFQETYGIQFNQVEAPRVRTSIWFPRVDYREAVFTVTGRGHYHDFGRFMAAFENAFPHARLLHVDLEPLSFASPDEEDAEKLRFQFDLMILIKPKKIGSGV